MDCPRCLLSQAIALFVLMGFAAFVDAREPLENWNQGQSSWANQFYRATTCIDRKESLNNLSTICFLTGSAGESNLPVSDVESTDAHRCPGCWHRLELIGQSLSESASSTLWQIKNWSDLARIDAYHNDPVLEREIFDNLEQGDLGPRQTIEKQPMNNSDSDPYWVYYEDIDRWGVVFEAQKINRNLASRNYPKLDDRNRQAEKTPVKLAGYRVPSESRKWSNVVVEQLQPMLVRQYETLTVLAEALLHYLVDPLNRQFKPLLDDWKFSIAHSAALASAYDSNSDNCAAKTKVTEPGKRMAVNLECVFSDWLHVQIDELKMIVGAVLVSAGLQLWRSGEHVLRAPLVAR